MSTRQQQEQQEQQEQIDELTAHVERLSLYVAHLCARATNIETVMRLRKLSSLQTDRTPIEFPNQFSPGAYDQIVRLVQSDVLACPAAAPAQLPIAGTDTK